jgi:DNA polymerase elongation subunit (family B)|tara:strand:- start:355 stop:1008 length:654 start_codon:yes stop_codon:yes gene_type:complete
MKVIALDIETKNLDMEAEGLDFNNPKGWEVSCVSIYHPNHKPFNYAQWETLPSDVMEEYTVMSFQQLEEDLQAWWDDGYTLITKNGTNFDLPIISKPIAEGGCGLEWVIQDYILGDNITSRHLDLQTYLEDATFGVRFSLQTLIKSVLGADESKLMEAKFAPQAWADGNYAEVIQYCGEDARYTYQVWRVARDRGYIQASGKSPEGNYEDCYIRIRW